MGDKYLPAGMKQIRAYVPIATAERLGKVAKALNVTVTELGGQCVVNGIDQAVEDRIMQLEATLDELRRETGRGNGNGNGHDHDHAQQPLPLRIGRAERAAAEVRHENRRLNRDQRTADERRPRTSAVRVQ